MTTIIDELIVVLGIDTSKFTEGQRDALAAFKKGKEGAEEFGKRVEEQGMKMSEVFGIARRGALGLLGAFVGGEAVSFVDHVMKMDASAGRLSKTIHTNVENLALWQNMIRQIGGDSNSATGALNALQQEINSVRQGGGMFEGGFASLMNQSGAWIRDDADTVLRKVRGFISGQVESGKMQPDEAATFLRRVPGMNQDMVNLLLGDFKKIEESAKAVGGATAASAKAAEDLQGKLHLVVQAMEQFGRAIIPIVNLLMKPIKDITKQDVVGSGAFGMGVTFDKGGFMDRLDTWLWGEYGQHGGGSPGGKGGSRGDRNNNPGNIEYGPFAVAHGATGTDGRFAKFPTAEAGESAMADLLLKSYQGLTLEQIQRKWVGNDDAGYVGSMSKATGLAPGAVPNLQDPLVRRNLMSGMARGEGSHLGAGAAARDRASTQRPTTSTSSSSTSIGQVVLPGVTDADSFAREIEPALKRQSLLAPINYGLT